VVVLTAPGDWCTIPRSPRRGSSVVEHLTVDQVVVGSNPAPGASSLSFSGRAGAVRGDSVQNELTLRQMVNGISALFAVMTPDGAVEDVNRAVLDYFGKTIEELKEWASTDAVHPDDLPGVIAVWSRSLESGQPYDIELRQRGADGVYRWFHVQGLPVRDAEGRIIRWCVLQTNIDDRRRAEEALRESERELRELIDSVPGMIIVADSAGQQYANKRFLDFTGATVDEIRGFGGLSLIHPDEREMVMNEWLRCNALGQPMELDHRLKRCDGIYRWVHVRIDPLLDDQGHIVRWYGLLTDVDVHREMEEALRSTRRKLSAAMQIATVAELSASIAHEINQPLASVVTNAHACQTWLAHDPPNLERALVTLERIIRDGHSAAEVVRRIRALFKETPPVKAVMDVNQTVAEVLRVLADELRDNSITVEADLESDLPLIAADPVQIQQTLINLVHNAIEAMVGLADHAKLLVLTSRRKESEILIQVRDHGAGVKDPALIFEPFFSTKASGMGIGLSICRSIVEAHGGRVWATANEEAGTTFSFTLSLSSDDMASQA
jgi:PAS domain S-box-containing protein